MNKRMADAKLFWNDQMNFTDHYKNNTNYSQKALDTLDNQYINVDHEAVPLLVNLNTGLYNFGNLMKLNRTDLKDTKENIQIAQSIFESLEAIQNKIESEIRNSSKASDKNKIYSSALEYSKHFINHQVSELEGYEPQSLALKWYRECVKSNPKQTSSRP